jgi:hypothetical protein
MPSLNFQNIGPVGSGSVNATFGNKAAPAKSAKKGDRMGYKRLAKNRNGSVKEMKAAIKEHNKRYCISTTGNKAALKQKMKRVDKKLSTIAKTEVVDDEQVVFRFLLPFDCYQLVLLLQDTEDDVHVQVVVHGELPRAVLLDDIPRWVELAGGWAEDVDAFEVREEGEHLPLVVYHIHEEIRLPATGRRHEQHVQRREPRVEGLDGVLDGDRLYRVLAVGGRGGHLWLVGG